MNDSSLKELYSTDGKIVVASHRGFSAEFPENTLLAFEKAVEAGTDIVEFDVRLSRDGVPVILHDDTMDRTTDGHGPLADYTFAELKRLNASFWRGCHDTGVRLDRPLLPDVRMPSLEEALAALAGRVFLNIQVCCPPEGWDAVAAAYARHELYGRAFLMVESFVAAEAFRRIDPAIDLCVGEDRGNLRRHKEFGLTFIQPFWESVDAAFCREIKRLGLCANMYYSNTAEGNQRYLEMGLRGIMTDNPVLLAASIAAWKAGKQPCAAEGES